MVAKHAAYVDYPPCIKIDDRTNEVAIYASVKQFFCCIWIEGAKKKVAEFVVRHYLHIEQESNILLTKWSQDKSISTLVNAGCHLQFVSDTP